MSGKRSHLGPDEVRRLGKLKFDLIAAASVDDALKAGAFRFFVRVLGQLDLATFTCTISDERLCAELPECRHRWTANDHRAAIRDAGYWTFDSGSGRHPSRYFVSEEIPQRVLDQITVKNQALSVARAPRLEAAREVVRRPRKSASRGGPQPPDTVVPTPPVQVSSSAGCRSQNLTQDVHTREPERCACGQPAVRGHRLRPSPSHPNGTPWKYECAACLDDDDRIPMADDEFRELAPPEARTPRAAARNSDEAYRMARDGG